MKKRKIILDCDPGHDDAMAILLAGASPEIDLLGITTVAGNSYVNNTTRNALVLTEMAEIPVNVAQGASRPIVREQIVAPNIHGESGLEGANLPSPKTRPHELDAVHFMAEKISDFPHEVTLVPVGPLTNIALLLIQYPQLVDVIPEIVLMGGGIAFGNTTPVAEFNIFADPEAAAIVFRSGIPITVCGLDLTHQAKIYMPEIKKLQAYSSQVVSKMGLLLEFFHQTYFDVFRIEGAPLHDPCTIAYLVSPELFTGEYFYTQVELRGSITYGQTVVDYWHQSKEKPNAKWLMTIDREKYIALIFDRMKHYR